MRTSRRMATHAQGGKIKQPLYTGSYTITTIGAYVYMHLLTSGTLTIQSKGDYDLFAVGGGSSGLRYGNGTASTGGGGGGGGGYTNRALKQTLNKGQALIVAIGAGGAVHTTGKPSNSGSTTSLGSVTAAGGSGGSDTQSANGGSGGGTRGVAWYSSEDYWWWKTQPGNGGSDGSNGQIGAFIEGSNFPRTAGTGQGSTTRAFGDSTGTLYAGGGGGGGDLPRYTSDITRGLGGAGGGGHGGYRGASLSPTSGTGNTGGGGGGGSYGTDVDPGVTMSAGAAGGSGIAIIRWTA